MTDPATSARPTGSRRPRSRALRDRVVVVWFVLAIAVTVVHRWLPGARWLMVHMVVLGAVSHSIMVWSAHFATTILKSRPDADSERAVNTRLLTLLVGTCAVVVGVPTRLWPLTTVGAVLVAAAMVLHARAMMIILREAFPGRFRIVVRYYISAAAYLPLGATFGVLMARGQGDAWHSRLLAAHTVANFLGWIGLTLIGTLVTLWPTMLRTKMHEKAESIATQMLWPLHGALVVAMAGALAGSKWVLVGGLTAYLVVMLRLLPTFLQPAKRRPPREFASASMACALLWALAAMGYAVFLVAVRGLDSLADFYTPVTVILVAGVAVQAVTGALSYLIPSVLGGGPSVVRAGQFWMNRWGAVRLVTINVGLVVCLLPVPSAIRAAVSIGVLAAMTLFVPILFAAIRASLAARRAKAAGAALPEPEPKNFWSGQQVLAAALLVIVLAGSGAAMNPQAAGMDASSWGSGARKNVAATGQTTTVRVEAKDMRYTPSSIDVPLGNRLEVELVNTDAREVHDLVIAGVKSKRLKPGESQRIVVDKVDRTIVGTCTIVGHKQMGMLFVVKTSDQGAEQVQGAGAGPGVRAPIALDANAALHNRVDPVLAPLPPVRLRKVTLRVQELPLEVAPGVWQKRWTFNGGPVGPTLHGRVGDTFEVTLINEGSMGHSIDFHAGDISPDLPMRTIPPGESLVYRFEAKRAGAWLYHCSTMPMSSHIAAGMHGAVIIEPATLDPVVRQYVLVQSEMYLGEVARTSQAASEVNADRVNALTADLIGFNGVANHYVQQPLTAEPGERVRVWVVAAGPNFGSNFHVVGAQFDTVYREGGYLIKSGRDAFGGADGGSQTLSLGVSQGGFVEMTLREAGTYVAVDHSMVRAELGARALIKVGNVAGVTPTRR